MCKLPVEQVELGTDGCSAPNFAVPLFNAALGFARMCDPRDMPEERAQACRRITSAMSAYPEMASGYGEFDEQLMKAGNGKIITKRGAEGYQIVGLLSGTRGADSPGVGIAIKVSDGDASRMGMELESSNRVRPAVTIEILRQLGVLSPEQQRSLAAFGPEKTITNHRGIVTGISHPVFRL